MMDDVISELYGIKQQARGMLTYAQQSALDTAIDVCEKVDSLFASASAGVKDVGYAQTKPAPVETEAGRPRH